MIRMRDVIVGTAGHIDHGKTALVKALTGIDTDRLEEEKRRGITIDIGFAHMCLDDYRIGFVETPQDDSPFGVRSYSEHGIIGMPAALANALSAALGKEITELPLIPEKLWELSSGGAG
jgi:hypothetical protein